MEEGGRSNPTFPPEDSQRNELTEGLAENVVVFQQCIDEMVAAVDRDVNSNEVTAESYDKKKSYMKQHLQELSNLHDSLADQYADLIEEISMNRQSQIQSQDLQSSESSSSPQVSQILGPEGKGPSDSGSESSMSYVDKPPLPPVNDDALKVEETEVLAQKISNLESEVESWKQKLQSLTVENGELKQEVKENVTDIRVYMSESKLETKAMEEQLKASKRFAKTAEESKRRILAENLSRQSKHDAQITEMTNNISQSMNELSQLKNTHEEKEKVWKGAIEQLKHDVKKKTELVAELSKIAEDLILEKSDQNNVIHQLKNDLVSAKLENAGLLPPMDNVQKLTDELKLKVEELEREVEKQREAMSEGDRK